MDSATRVVLCPRNTEEVLRLVREGKRVVLVDSHGNVLGTIEEAEPFDVAKSLAAGIAAQRVAEVAERRVLAPFYEVGIGTPVDAPPLLPLRRDHPEPGESGRSFRNRTSKDRARANVRRPPPRRI